LRALLGVIERLRRRGRRMIRQWIAQPRSTCRRGRRKTRWPFIADGMLRAEVRSPSGPWATWSD
jgi:hypothetical protein